MSTKNSMTRRQDHSNPNATGLTAFLMTASVIATFAGARLLALQESDKVAPTAQAITVVEPVSNSGLFFQPRSDRGLKIELKPIPQVARPQINPVARSQSSL